MGLGGGKRELDEREDLMVGFGSFVVRSIAMAGRDASSLSVVRNFYTWEERSLYSPGTDRKSRAVVVSRSMNLEVAGGTSKAGYFGETKGVCALMFSGVTEQIARGIAWSTAL